MSSPDLEAWAALKGAFARLLRAQRTGRPLEEVALYLAELTTPHGLALARAIHAAKLGPDPERFRRPQHERVTVGVLTVEEMVTAATNAGPLFEHAAVELRGAPPPHHVRVLFATERAEVVHLHLAVFGASTDGGVS